MKWKLIILLQVISKSNAKRQQKSDTDIIHEANRCTWYDQCYKDGDVWYNCLSNRKSKRLEDETGLKILKEMCPSLYGDGTKVKTCCSTAQLSNMESQMQIPYTLLSRCPSCWKNFLNFWCQMTCSPDQSLFTNAIETKEIPNKPNKRYISKLGYAVNMSFADGLYQSCKNVSNPTTGSKALDIICGNWEDGCSGSNWLKFLTDKSINQLVPFPIEVHSETTDDLPELMNSKIFKCNETAPGSPGPCSCNDCPACCPHAPEIPDDPEPLFPEILGYNGWTVLVIFGYVLFIWAFGTVVIAWHLFCANKEDIREGCCTLVDYYQNDQSNDHSPIDGDTIQHTQMNSDEYAGDQGCWTNMTNSIDFALSNFFFKLGFICATYPRYVLPSGLLATIVLGLGLMNYQITTDPVELWSSPTSQARQEKNYFDGAFGKFFRTEQMIFSIDSVVDWEAGKSPLSVQNLSMDFVPYTESTTNIPPTIKFSPLFQKEILAKLIDIQNDVLALTAPLADGQVVSLSDICLKPMAPVNNNCTFMSVTNYFQNSKENLNKEVVDEFFGDLLADYHTHLIGCTRNPTTIQDSPGLLDMSCLGSYGGPINPNVAIGSFDAKNYMNGTHAVISIPVLNDEDSARRAFVWEKAFLDYIQNWITADSLVNVTNLNPDMLEDRPDWVTVRLTVAYTSERSVEDEIERESGTDVTTVLFSYIVMFAYVSFALGQFTSCSRIFIDSKITVGFVGVLIVMASIVCSLGIFSYAGVKMTLIIIEVLPFLVLAVGVDNIFILVQHLQRDRPADKETVEMQIARVLGEVGPSMFLSSGSETVAFFIGALSTMPAVRSFSMFAGAAVLFDFLLQVTCFVSVLTLDEKRRRDNRFDLTCCIKYRRAQEPEAEDGLLYYITKRYFTRLLLNSIARPLIIILFAGGTAYSLASLPNLDIGLDQKLSMPEDSYLINYFETMSESLEVGAPVYFVIKDGLEYSDHDIQNGLCGGAGCNADSLPSSISQVAQISSYSTIAVPAMNWIDDYFDWVSPDSPCCRVFKENNTFCDSSVPDRLNICDKCLPDGTAHPSGGTFDKFVPYFLSDPPSASCPRGGSAAYSGAVNISESGHIGASYFMTYHTPARTSADFIKCITHGRAMAEQLTENLKNISKSDSVEVFTYSIFYVFYEQYLTIVYDSILNIGICILAVTIITMLMLGCATGLCVATTIFLIILNLMGVMVAWDISLNAVSLVNLVMATGIAVEFCSHIARAFAKSEQQGRVARARDALAEMGSSVLSGITFTKFGGIVVLAFSKTQIFQIFYFRMYLSIVLLGALHGFLFLPVLLSYVGPVDKVGVKKRQPKVTEPSASTEDESLPSNRDEQSGPVEALLSPTLTL